MRHLWLLLLIAGGSVQFPGVLTLPEALPAKSGGGGGGGVTAQAAGEASPDYGEYEDDDSQRAPGNLAKSTAGPKIPDPYFEQKEVTIYVAANATSVKLECPVKNYDAAHHVILWYKDGVVVTTGKTIVNNIYGLDNQFTLTVPLNSSNGTEQRFSCSANASSDIRHKVTIRFGPEPSTPAPSTVPAAAVTPSPANDSAPIGRDIGLLLLALILAPLQLSVSSALF
ncbi:uncharacterized protein [Drosophila kikkawai]|uniref:Ig-like domain-containing protein n=1 Tax=Drosophila kikkawai TaxID=30033 RepID=A0A6P4IDQ4_DROKI|nr:uncharacterized protein LOC108078004 [Drosophila kikkawai]